MINHLDIESIFQDSFDEGNSSTFKTSTEVIQKTMNGARETREGKRTHEAL